MIQKVLFENKAALAQRGILYPKVNLRGFGHHDIAYLLDGGYPSYATAQPKTLAQIEAELTLELSGFAGSIIFSSENFYLFPQPSALRSLLERTGALTQRTPAIIVYVRRQDDAHESWYNQTIKAQGLTHDLQTCINQCLDIWDYNMQLSAWAATFGEAALIVRPYEKEQFTGCSLLMDFLRIVGAAAVGFDFIEERVNSGLNGDLLEFQRIVNKLPLTNQEKRRYHRQLIELSARSAASGLFNDEPIMKSSMRHTLIARYAEGNALVARRFLNRDTLFIQAPPLEAQSSESNSDRFTLSTEKLALVIGWLMSSAG